MGAPWRAALLGRAVFRCQLGRGYAAVPPSKGFPIRQRLFLKGWFVIQCWTELSPGFRTKGHFSFSFLG